MKLIHWLAIILLLAVFTLIGTFSTVALVKQAMIAIMEDYTNHYGETIENY